MEYGSDLFCTYHFPLSKVRKIPRVDDTVPFLLLHTGDISFMKIYILIDVYTLRPLSYVLSLHTSRKLLV